MFLCVYFISQDCHFEEKFIHFTLLCLQSYIIMLKIKEKIVMPLYE